jgi:hypothetical protein
MNQGQQNMNRLIVTLIFGLIINLQIYAQDKSDLIFLKIKYHHSFSFHSEIYDINMIEKTVKFSFVRLTNDSLEVQKLTSFSPRKWDRLSQMIEKIQFDSIVTFDKQGIDGGWFNIDLTKNDGMRKGISIWDGYAPESLKELFRFLSKDIKNKQLLTSYKFYWGEIADCKVLASNLARNVSTRNRFKIPNKTYM